MRIWSIVVALIIASTITSAEITGSASDMFSKTSETDVRGRVNNLFTVDLDGDGDKEIVTDSVLTMSFGKSGLVYALDHTGGELWKHHAGLMNDLYVSEKGTIVVGTGGQLQALNTDGSVMWKKSVRTSNIQKIYDQSVYATDLDTDGKDEIFSATNFGSLRGTILQMWSSDGAKLTKMDFKGTRFPKTFTSIDLTQDGEKEIIVGLILFAPNTIAGTITPAYNKPALVVAMDYNGNKLWEVDTPSGVTALASNDVDGDGKPEILVGLDGRLLALKEDGKQKWDKEINGRIRAIKILDVNDDNALEIVVAAGMLYVLDNTGKEIWKYNTGSIYDASLADLDGDGKMEVATAAREIRLLGSDGSLIWKSDRTGDNHGVEFADMQNTGFPNIVFGGKDGMIHIYDSGKYGRLQKAEFHYTEADKLFKEKDYNASRYNALKAKQYYDFLSDEPGSMKCENLANKNNVYISAKGYYDLTLNYLNEGNHDEAEKFAEKAIEEFRKVGDLRKLNEVSALLNRAKMHPKAVANLEIAKAHYKSGNWSNSSYFAGKSKEQFMYIGDLDGIEKSDKILKESVNQIKAIYYIQLAANHTKFGEYENASHNLNIAHRLYAELNDTQGMEKVDGIISNVRGNVYKGGVLMKIAIIVVVFIFILILVIIVMSLKITFKTIKKKKIGKPKNPLKWVKWNPEDDYKRKKPKGSGLSRL